MRYTGLLVGSLLSVFVFARPALAQEEYTPKQGDLRIGMTAEGGSGISYADIDGWLKTTKLSLSADYFLNSSFSVGIGFDWTEDKVSGETVRTTGYGIGIGYYFVNPSTTNVLPYLKAEYAAFDTPGVDPSGYVVTGGAHIFLNPNASVDVSIQYVNIRGGGEKFDGFGATVGFSLWFR